jgi:hypothetical protein
MMMMMMMVVILLFLSRGFPAAHAGTFSRAPNVYMNIR